MNSLNQEANVLIVDDVSSNLILLSQMVQQAGYIARPVVTVKQALKAIDVCIPGLILLDVSMPDMNGFEFCQMLKKRVDTRDIPIIFISALDSTINKMRGFQAGAVDYISKPFELEEVTMRINTHMRMRMMQREMQIQNSRLQKLLKEQMVTLDENRRALFGVLKEMICMRFPYCREHLNTVSQNVVTLAMSLQFSNDFKASIDDEFIEFIGDAAFIHDIGMIGVPDEIIRSEQLSENDGIVLQKHTTEHLNGLIASLQTKKETRSFEMAVEIAKYHHERYDGSGYPEGLSGENIPLSARIVAIVDCFDALQRRNLRGGTLTRKESIQYMVEHSGTTFDPKIIEIFLKILDQLK